MQTFFPATRLAFRLLLRVLLVCLLFSFAIGAVFSYLTYHTQLANEENKLLELQAGLLAPLAEDVWALDEPGIRLQLDAISRILPSAAIRLTTVEARSYTDGREMPADPSRTHALPLIHPRSATPLGTLEITLDTSVIRQQVRERMVSDAVGLLGLTLVIALTLGFFVYHLIVRRLTILSRFARTLDLDALDRSTLHLPIPAKKQDELDDLTESIERMRQRISQDMLAARAMQRELSFQASHDPLTGLGNRSHLSTRSAELLASGTSTPEIAFVFVDIDRFKLINDTLGHLVGDHLLRALADRIRSKLPDRAELFRPGSDEFLLLVPEPSAEPSVREIIRNLQESLAAPFEIEHHALSVTVSIGVASSPDNGSELSTLLKHTDIALQAAKQTGRNHACFFTPDLLARLNEQVRIETLLRGALGRNEFHLVYQPQIDIASGRVIGAEALLRWENDALGKVPPDRFIPVAEDTGLIIPIGAWVLRQAIIEWRRWQESGLTGVPVSVNLSAAQLRHAELLEAIRDLCLEEAMPPEALELEVTESILMDDVDVVAGKLATFRDMGIRIAVDDFGTGYSSLSYLKHLPIDRLKIDRSFISDIPGDPNDTAIAVAIIRLAQALNLEVIAEGVESAEQAALLMQEGCAQAQGYFYARPLPGDEFVRYARTANDAVKAARASSTAAG